MCLAAACTRSDLRGAASRDAYSISFSMHVWKVRHEYPDRRSSRTFRSYGCSLGGFDGLASAHQVTATDASVGLRGTGTPMTLIFASWCRAVSSTVACAAFHTAPMIGNASAGRSYSCCSACERDAKGCGILCHCPVTSMPLVCGVQGANTQTLVKG